MIRMDVQTILVPTDFSEHSAHAFEAALDLARAFGAGIELIHCYPPSAVVAPYGVALPVALDKEIRDAANAQLAEWAEKAAAAGIKANASVSPAAPVSGILDRAKQTKASLIVMGTRGLSGLKHALLGSVAERTIRLAKCPVLTIKADAD
jgi:nucleotide-binding universal stress UspA family protein